MQIAGGENVSLYIPGIGFKLYANYAIMELHAMLDRREHKMVE